MVISTSSKLLVAKSRYHIRSVSLPSKSNPIILRIVEELNKLKPWEEHDPTPQVETITNGLSSLLNLYRCIDEEVLMLGSTKQAFSSSHHKETYKDELLESSLRLLDVSATSRDLVVKLKESVRDLQLSLRRKIRHDNNNDVVSRYFSSRKDIMKLAKSGISSLRRMDEELLGSASSSVFEDESTSNMLTVVKVLRCASLINVSVYNSLLSFLTVPVVSQKSKWRSSKWSLVSRLVMVNKDVDTGEEESSMSLKSVEVCLNMLCEGNSCSLEVVQSKLKGLEVALEEIEGGLDCLFRQLVKTRSSLLNLISNF